MNTNGEDTSWDIASLDSRIKVSLFVCLVSALCYLTARLGGTLALRPSGDWPLWPANVLVVAILLVTPPRLWPILMTAAFAAFVAYDLQSGLTIRTTILLILSDTVEVLTAALGLRHAFKGAPQLNSLSALAKYAFWAVILAPFAGAFFGALAAKGNYGTSWRISFCSEAIAFLTLLPAILAWIGHARDWVRAPLTYYLEALVLMAVIIFLSYYVFIVHGTASSPALLYSLVPFLLWSALRFGAAGAGTSATIVALLSIWGAAHGRGPFNGVDTTNNVLSLQLFLLSAAAPFMVLAALVEQRGRAELVLRESERRFRLVADTAPVMIWMSRADKRFSFFNQRWLKFAGQSSEQALEEGWTSRLHPEDAKRCAAIYSASFDARVEFEMEFRLRCLDGNYYWFVDFGIPRFEPDGTFCGYIGSCVDITERKLSEESLHSLSGRLIRAQEEERARIARELHDDFSQRLAVLSIGLGQLSKRLAGVESEQKAQVSEMLKATMELSTDLHSLSHQLHSSKLEHVGLVAALSGLCREIGEKYKLEIQFSKAGFSGEIPKGMALCLFRVAQESLSNVVRHSHAKNVYVELGANRNGISLRIRDDGRGFDTTSRNPSAGIGLIGMHERLRLIGGRLLVTSEINGGTEVLGEVPLAVSPSSSESIARAAG